MSNKRGKSIREIESDLDAVVDEMPIRESDLLELARKVRKTQKEIGDRVLAEFAIYEKTKRNAN